MGDYTLAVGTHDPHGFAADTTEGAIQGAVRFVVGQFADELQSNPQEVVTLMGPTGLVTRSGERLDEFVGRVAGANLAGAPDTVQPGDTNTPDCNGG